VKQLQILVRQSLDKRQTRKFGDTYVLHFLEAYTEEQKSFIRKFSSSAGAEVARLFSPACCLMIYALPACSAFPFRRDRPLQFAIQHAIEPNKPSYERPCL